MLQRGENEEVGEIDRRERKIPNNGMIFGVSIVINGYFFKIEEVKVGFTAN